MNTKKLKKKVKKSGILPKKKKTSKIGTIAAVIAVTIAVPALLIFALFFFLAVVTASYHLDDIDEYWY